MSSPLVPNSVFVTNPPSPLFASLRDAAATASEGQAYPAATLYVVATPIGNLADLTLRAIHVLAMVDAIACEDTRHSGSLLRHLGIEKPLLPVHEHNERDAASSVLVRLAAGERVAYVSDAGTPAISDPGAALVAAAHASGYRTIPIPGASSVIAALSVSGDAHGAAFAFSGFLSVKAGERAQQLAAVASSRTTQVLFEAPHRVEGLAKSLAVSCPARRLTVCRELTKQFETVATMQAADWPAWLKSEPHRTRGEFVVVLHALAASAEPGDTQFADEDRTLRCLMAALPLKQAVSLSAELTKASRNRLYERALQLKAAGAEKDGSSGQRGDEAAPTIAE